VLDGWRPAVFDEVGEGGRRVEVEIRFRFRSSSGQSACAGRRRRGVSAVRVRVGRVGERCGEEAVGPLLGQAAGVGEDEVDFGVAHFEPGELVGEPVAVDVFQFVERRVSGPAFAVERRVGSSAGRAASSALKTGSERRGSARSAFCSAARRARRRSRSRRSLCADRRIRQFASGVPGSVADRQRRLRPLTFFLHRCGRSDQRTVSARSTGRPHSAEASIARLTRTASIPSSAVQRGSASPRATATKWSASIASAPRTRPCTSGA
jgi:hypothetical protein